MDMNELLLDNLLHENIQLNEEIKILKDKLEKISNFFRCTEDAINKVVNDNRWHPISEKPKHRGYYDVVLVVEHNKKLVMSTYYNGNQFNSIFPIIYWRQVPQIPEGECDD